jgi:hypothetical protein
MRLKDLIPPGGGGNLFEAYRDGGVAVVKDAGHVPGNGFGQARFLVLGFPGPEFDDNVGTGLSP